MLYGLDRRVWGEGFATEAAIQFGFDTAGLHRISANAEPENTASIKVMKRLEISFEGSEVRDGGTLIHYGIRRKAKS